MPRDSLRSIARTVWGDSSLWYLIADANGLDGNSRLVVGQRLVIPARVNGANNNVGVFRPYDALATIGDTNPNLPAPPPQRSGGGGGCGIIGQIIVAIIAIVVTIFLTPIVTAALAPALGATGAAIVGGAVAAAAGNIAGQVVGNVVGIQNGFDWKAVAVAGLTAGITQGITGSGGLALGSAPTDVALRAAINTAVNQGLRVAVGLQSSFNWRMVAASALGAFAGAVVGDAIGAAQYGEEQFAGLRQDEPWKLNQDFGNNFAREFGSGLVRNVVTTAVSGGKLNAVNLVSDAFGNALGTAIGGYLTAPGQQQEAQQRAQEQAEAEARRAELIRQAAYERQAAFEREVSENIEREDLERGREMQRAAFEREVSDNIDREDAERGRLQPSVPTGQDSNPMGNMVLQGTTLDWNSTAPTPAFNPWGIPIWYGAYTNPSIPLIWPSGEPVNLPSAPAPTAEERINSVFRGLGYIFGVYGTPEERAAWAISTADSLIEGARRLGSAAYNDPKGFGIGVAQGAVNFVPHLINGTGSILQYSASGYVYMAELGGLVSPGTGDAVYNYQLPHVPTWAPTSDANLAGSLVFDIGTLAVPLAWSSLPGRGAAITGEVAALSDIAAGTRTGGFWSRLQSPITLDFSEAASTLNAFPGDVVRFRSMLAPVATADTAVVARTVAGNTVYYTLDAEGNTLSATGSLRQYFSGADRASAEVRAQTAAAETGITGDQGGHLVGHRFVLDQGPINMFPQEANFNMGAFRILENDYARLIDRGYRVEFAHTLGDFSAAGRPGSLSVTYSAIDVRGSIVESWVGQFMNQPGQTYIRRVR
jgi:hypothetical protein